MKLKINNQSQTPRLNMISNNYENGSNISREKMNLDFDEENFRHEYQYTETTKVAMSDSESDSVSNSDYIESDKKQSNDMDIDQEEQSSGDGQNDLLESTVDDGKTNLYPNLDVKNFPFKTSETLLDEVLNDQAWIKNGHKILGKPTIVYSKNREYLSNSDYKSYIWYSNDQISLQSKYSYESISCPNLNNCKITVFMGILYDSDLNLKDSDDIESVKSFHVKITVKERHFMNLKLKDIERFHLIAYDDLHQFDSLDLHLEPNSLDSAIYLSPVTNKLIMIEILEPEFSPNELSSLKTDKIAERYNEYYKINSDDQISEKETESLPPVPSQLKCISFMFKILKGALNETCKKDKKKILTNSHILNVQMDPKILTNNFNFQIIEAKGDGTTSTTTTPNDEINDTSLEFYEAPDLFDFNADHQRRLARDAYTRKAMESVFIGQLIQKQFYNTPEYSSYFKLFQTSTSPMFWFNLIGQNVGNPTAFLNRMDNDRYYNYSKNFVTLNTFMHYHPHTIINNFKKSIQLDPTNTSKYYDSLEYICSIYNNKQLYQYIGTLDIVGDEALKSALLQFELTKETIPDDIAVYTIYKTKKTVLALSNEVDNQKSNISLKNSLRTLSKYLNSDFLKFLVDHEPFATYSEAYNLLGLDPSIKDYDWIQTSYMLKVSDQPTLKVDCDRALFTIAIYLKQLPLFTLLFEQEPQYSLYFSNLNGLSIEEAYKELGINENCNEDTIIEVFKANWEAINTEKINVNYDQLLTLRKALYKVATYKNSTMLENYIQTGVVDESYLPSGEWPVGLCNIGNTCYLNSLLQYYFTIEPLRTYILNYNEKAENLIKENEKRRIGGREVSTFEVQRSIKFISQLKTLYHEMIHTKYKLTTPSEQLVYLAFAPAEFMQEDESNSIENSENIENGAANNEVKISADQLEMTLEIGRQQDVTECIGNFLDQLETVTLPLKLDKDFEQYDLIKKIFYGVLKQNFMNVENSQYIGDKERRERFSSLLVSLSSKPRNLYDALDQFFNDEEEIEMSDTGKVKRVLEVIELPLILQIQIQRVEFDKVRYIPIKNTDPLPFDETIYLDKYMENGVSDEIKKAYECKKLKLNELKIAKEKLLAKNEVGQSVKTSLLSTQKFLESDFVQNELGIDEHDLAQTLEALHGFYDDINKKIEKLALKIAELEISIDNHFASFQNNPYSLFAVFVHRGEASYGHYWVYIKDFDKQIWRKYNDELVSEVPEEEVFNFASGNTATPYFLAYIKDDHKKDVEALKRVINSSVLEF